MLRTLKNTINVLHLIVTKLITFTFILVIVTAYSEHTSSTHNIYIGQHSRSHTNLTAITKLCQQGPKACTTAVL